MIKHSAPSARIRAFPREHRRAFPGTVASERYAMLRSLGVTRTTVCLRVFEEFYSMANVYERRG
jgi:hypothetical protein